MASLLKPTLKDASAKGKLPASISFTVILFVIVSPARFSPSQLIAPRHLSSLATEYGFLGKTGSTVLLRIIFTTYLCNMIPLFYVGVIVCSFIGLTLGCTDILVTPGASIDGSSFIAYNADAPTLMGVIYHYPASKKSSPAKRAVYDWDSGVYLGEIDEVNSTNNVVGNSNEHGLIVGETTFGGHPLLAWNQTGAVIDYGSLIYITLQRAKTAREAIHTMSDLMDTYGYASGGESFSIADTSGEVWLMEAISTGNTYKRKGAVWVAIRIPDGAVASHANHARIRQFPRDDPDNCLFSADVVEVAVHYGLFGTDSDPSDFSFSDIYDPPSFLNVRQGEARVWSVFSQLADTTGDFESRYKSYALGQDLSNRMPLYVYPFKKISLDDVMQLMTSHYEGTLLDSSVDVGSGLFESPYRPRPLQWEHQGTLYHNERSIATPKTGWNFIGQIRPWIQPAELSSLLWFGCDDSSTSPRIPVYSASKMIPQPYAGSGSQDGVSSPLLQLDIGKAFWVQNMVANLAYFRWNDIYPLIRKKIDALQKSLRDQVDATDAMAMQLHDTSGLDEAVAFLTNYTVSAGEDVHRLWWDFYGELFVQFRDFYNIVPKENEPVCGCEAREPGMSDTVKERIIKETGDHYRVATAPDHSSSGGFSFTGDQRTVQ